MTVRTDPSSGEAVGRGAAGGRMPRPRRRLDSLAALAGYLAVSVWLFGRPILADPRGTYVGWGADPTTFIWYLRWWPYAIGHGLNPLTTHLLWAPQGVNLAGANALPGPSLVAAPLTLLAGPVVAYNVLALVAPALSAWTTYLLCRHLTDRFWPSVLGGFLFGFSTYELGRVLGHLNLALVFLVPLFVLLVLRRLEGSVGPRAFVAWTAAIVVGQFLISGEVLLTATLFGAVALGIGFVVETPERRRALAATVGRLAIGYAVAGVVLLPYLIEARSALSHPPIWDFYPTFYSADLANLVVPTLVTRIGSTSGAAISARFTGNLSEEVAYLGIPLLAILVAYAVQGWRTRAARVLLGTFVVVVVAAFGPKLHVAGRETIWMPWKLASAVPFLRYALPGRFMVYAFLITAIVTALWLSRPGGLVPVRWVVAGLAVISLFPNLPIGIWQTRVDTPAFFADGTYRQYLAPGSNVLVIPFGDHGSSMLWQAQTDMAYRMPEGYVNVVPPSSFASWPALGSFVDGTAGAGSERQVDAFLGAKRVEQVVVVDGTPGAWGELFGHLDPTPVHVGGITLYRVPPEVLRDQRGATPPG